MSTQSDSRIESTAEELVITRVFDAPRDLVFEASTRTAHVRQWWGPRDFTMTVCEIDLRLGGAYRFVHRGPDGVEYPFKGEYREIVPPVGLVYTQILDMSGASDHELLVTVTFDDRDGATLLTGQLDFGSVENRVAAMETGMERGMAESLDRFAELLAALQGG